jgi:hypothetical protein
MDGGNRSQISISTSNTEAAMKKHELAHLETKIKELRATLASLADAKDFEEFIEVIHKPGFTTPAEAALFNGVVDSMAEQAKAVLGLKRMLLTGAAKVELNPQPLPP